ncbi:hypothetical protein Ancab_023941 [Ancistrocladus abbreviatus]
MEDDCEECRTWEEEMYWTHFQTLHFCHILKDDFHHQLVIPKKFAGNMWNKLPARVSLKCPSGARWDVELMASGEVMFLLDGWEEFVKACSLKENDILIFKYNGSSCFDVLMFDGENFCEKEAAYFIRKCGHAKPEDETQKKRDSREVTEEVDEDSQWAPSKKSKKDANDDPVASGQARLRWHVRTPKNSPPPEAAPAKGRAGSGLFPNSSRQPNTQPDGAGEPQNGAAKEKKYASGQQTNPEVNGSPSNESPPQGTPRLRGRPRKEIPLDSSKRLDAQPAELKPSTENGESNKQKPTSSQQSNLEDSGRTPKKPLKNGAKSGSRPRKGAASSSKKQKAKSAKKSPGIKGEYYMSNRRAVTELEKQKAMELAVNESADDSFVVVMRPTSVYKRFYMTIPAEWMNKHLSKQNQAVTLQMGDKTWAARFNYDHHRGGGGLSSGWKAFALENFLEEFDVCLFKLASQKDEPVVLEVTIFRVVPEVMAPTPVVDF